MLLFLHWVPLFIDFVNLLGIANKIDEFEVIRFDCSSSCSGGNKFLPTALTQLHTTGVYTYSKYTLQTTFPHYENASSDTDRLTAPFGSASNLPHTLTHTHTRVFQRANSVGREGLKQFPKSTMGAGTIPVKKPAEVLVRFECFTPFLPYATVNNLYSTLAVSMNMSYSSCQKKFASGAHGGHEEMFINVGTRTQIMVRKNK